ncbi:MAG TPA: hypothetical protein VF885_09310 [Arthrobacter sp.]
MTSVADSPVAIFDFTSDSEDYPSPSRGVAVLVLLGIAFLAVPASIVGLALVPFILGARALRISKGQAMAATAFDRVRAAAGARRKGELTWLNMP